MSEQLRSEGLEGFLLYYVDSLYYGVYVYWVFYRMDIKKDTISYTRVCILYTVWMITPPYTLSSSIWAGIGISVTQT